VKGAKTKSSLTAAQRDDLLGILQSRFEKNPQRHPGLAWSRVIEKLAAAPGTLWSLHEMERTGGEPDVVVDAADAGRVRFVDCSAQSPAGRTSLCYDREALESRKEFKPRDSALDLAAAMGIELLTEELYFALQQRGEFDTKSSSWLKTPADIRKLGGALFGDRRFGRVFVYHNGAQSYYSGRGFRGCLGI